MVDKIAQTGDGDPEAEAKAQAEAAAKAKAEAEAKEKDYVPRTQLLAALKSQDEKHAQEMSSLRTELTTKKPEPTEKVRYTRAQLATAVAAEQITQVEADQLWDAQLEADILAKTTETTTSLVKETQTSAKVDADLDRYCKLEPGILEPGSAIRQKVQDCFTYFLSLGDPNNMATQLKATRAALGPVEALEAAKAGETKLDPHKEAGGDGGGGDNKPNKEFKDTLTQRQKDYYTPLIGTIYKDWDAVEEELKPKKKSA